MFYRNMNSCFDLLDTFQIYGYISNINKQLKTINDYCFCFLKPFYWNFLDSYN